MKKSSAPYILRVVLTAIAFVMVLASALFSNSLAAKMRDEEQKKMELWAEATRALITATPEDNLDLPLTIIENNTTIPVYMTDAEGVCILHRNVPEGKDVQQRVDKLRESQEPIEVKVSDNVVQYIYYEDSRLLTWLTWFPYVNLAIVLVFMAVALLLVFTVQDAEQDRVWAGLSKETAHQLGTPISALNGWQEILKTTYPDDQMIPEMDADLKRLSTIADRFSKVGSSPELVQTPLLPVLKDSVAYMSKRTSGKVEIHLQAEAVDSNCEVMANQALLSWVIENLLRNAVDAMDGSGTITINITESSDRVLIDVADTGKGIARRDWHRIFMPGFTTKERGWGIGLSLSKRIIRTYHHGRIYVLHSTLGSGTTFRMELRKAI